MNPFTLLIKPASADCNLRCEYCFYLEKCEVYPETARHRMSDAVLEQMIKSYLATPQPVYTFGWQGGEPTLMGTDFFRKVAGFQETYGKAGKTVANGLQTNATLIDNEMAQLFKRYRFLLGCSLDGPAEIHDRYRLTIGGEPTHAKVLNGIETLSRHDVEFNILILVSQSNVRHAKTVYRYLVDQGFLYLQFIPCVEFDGDHPQPYAISGSEWGNFLCELFDAWYPEDAFTVSIRHVDALLLKIVDNEISVCNLGDNCCQYFVVEYNGDIYPCDFFVEPDRCLGNIMETDWEELLSSQAYRQFGAQKRQWNRACDSCEALALCQGDCLKHRMYGKNPPDSLSWLCEGNKRFIQHARDSLNILANDVRFKRAEADALSRRERVRSNPKYAGVGRNDPCPCGSGRKFKKCCGS
ncbi:MAG: anaerobic sulfatase maturase [Desulfobacterales bacterium]